MHQGTRLTQSLSKGLSAGADHSAVLETERHSSDGSEGVEDGYDGETSVADTETTSRGSLTSVD